MYAIIPAAGESSRMRLDLPAGVSSKVLLPFGKGDTVLVRSVQSVINAEVCRSIIIVARSSDKESVEEALVALKDTIPISVILGGKTRQESVFCGLCALAEKGEKKIEKNVEHVLIHDGARPQCPPQLIKEVALKGRETGAAILGYPITDTLKEVSLEEELIGTVSRKGIWGVQTPQVFRFDWLLHAHRKAREEGYLGTDDSELVERLGKKVSLVRGRRDNLKITTAEDLTYISQSFGEEEGRC